ncbi:MAG: mannose-6-phosphate isomerase [Salinivirgaceae bacterium]|jgi:mannose-6-phosphate isomerase|nr:mannose-6-phosphate isomerase [Salinivirgaceae bacterium]
MSELYPLKFAPIYKEKVWGGQRLRTQLNKNTDRDLVGESWELSCVEDNISVVTNGFLSGNELHELIEIYMGDLVGDRIFEQFGNAFPLLFKFIDANDVLSVKVHPDDKMAMEKHGVPGKTEMWYVVESEPNSYVYTGFSEKLNKAKLREHIKNNTVENSLNKEIAHRGDVFFVPAGRIHATGSGVLFAEIQQSSDITYRVYDWNRKGTDGKSRELHIDNALEALDFSKVDSYRSDYKDNLNEPVEITNCPYFVVNKLVIDSMIQRDYNKLDSFVVLMCVEGSAEIDYGQNEHEKIFKGETVLIPAVLESVKIIPTNDAQLLEVFVPAD